MATNSLAGESLPQNQLLALAALAMAVISGVSLAGAWGFEIFGGYAPCPLCLEQRIAYYAAVPAGILAAFLASKAPRAAAIILAAVCLGLIYNAGLGIYHAGAEWKFWPGPATCGATQDISAGGSLLKKLQNNRAIPCDQAALRIFGLSLAGYSVLISAGLAILSGYALYVSKAWQSRTV